METTPRYRRSVKPIHHYSKYIALALFLISALVRSLLAVFPKIAFTYADELIYLELAQNIWHHGAIALFRLPVSFSKFLYPLVISPFYAIAGSEARLAAISVFNAVLVSSAVFPAYLLGRRVIKNELHLSLALLVLAVAPELGFSMTYMAECLYIPLSLWAFYAAFRVFEDNRPTLRGSCILGVLLFLLYLTKEAALSLLAGVVILYIRGIFSWSRDRESRRQASLSFLAFLASCLVPFLLVRFLLFGNMGYSYANQASASYLTGPESLMYILYAAAYTLLYFLVSVLFFPVVLPLTGARKYDPAERNLLSLSAAYLVCAALGVAFGISLPEQFPTLEIRVHLRYFLPLLFPFIALFFSACESAANRSASPLRHPLFPVSVLLVLAGCLLLRPLSMGSLVDVPQLFGIAGLVPAAMDFSLGLKIFLAVFVLAGLVLFFLRKKKVLLLFTAASLLLLEAYCGSVFVAQAKHDMAIPSQEEAEHVAALDQLLDTLEGNVLYIRDSLFTPENRLFDSYSDDDCYVMFTDQLNRLTLYAEDPGKLDLSAGELPYTGLANSRIVVSSNYLNKEDIPSVRQIDWIICSDPTVRFSETMNEEINPGMYAPFRVFRSLNPSELNLVDPTVYELRTPVTFYGTDATCTGYPIAGFAPTEPNFTWTDGFRSRIVLTPEVEPGTPLKATFSVAYPYGKQHVTVYANGEQVFSEDITEGGDYSFLVPPSVTEKNKRINFTFELPNAVSAGGGDPRYLALAFRSFVLTRDMTNYALGTPILFYGGDANCMDYDTAGFGAVEPGWSWTVGSAAEITLKPETTSTEPLVGAFSIAYPMGQQRCAVFANDEKVFDAVLTEGGDYSFRVPVSVTEGGNPVRFRFELPDAAEPGNGDTRALALAFRSFVLSRDPAAYDLGTVIVFYGPSANCYDYPIEGFSAVESDFTWTVGHTAAVTLIPEMEKAADLLATFSITYPLGSQRCTIYANKEKVFSALLEEGGEYSFTIPASVLKKSKTVTLRFELPDAAEPGNGDPRLLGLAFRYLYLTEE